jgi:hypothetical protein
LQTAGRSTNPRWNERFDLYTFADHSKILEVNVHHRDMYREESLGRASINLLFLAPDMTHELSLVLQSGPDSELNESCVLDAIALQKTTSPYLRLLVTVSGQKPNSTPPTLDTQQDQPLPSLQPLSDYRLLHTLRDMRDVGLLSVTVHRAEQLMAADFNGKSDPYCVLQLRNCRVQTHTEYKTLTPEWQKTFHFRLRDIHDTLHVSLFDEDSDKRSDFLGCLAIPILTVSFEPSDAHHGNQLIMTALQSQIKDECRWFQLKERTLTKMCKGRIMLEFQLQYNVLRATWKTLQPQDKRLLDDDLRFKRAVIKHNVARVKQLACDLVDLGQYLHSCVEWEHPLRSVIAFVLFILTTYYFRLWMVPAFLLLPLLHNLVRFWFAGDSAADDLVFISRSFSQLSQIRVMTRQC